MSPLDASKTIAMSSDGEFDVWLREHRDHEQEVFVVIFKKASGRQTVTVTACRRRPSVMVGSTPWV